MTQNKNQNILYTYTRIIHTIITTVIRFLTRSGFKWIDPEELIRLYLSLIFRLK